MIDPLLAVLIAALAGAAGYLGLSMAWGGLASMDHRQPVPGRAWWRAAAASLACVLVALFLVWSEP